LFNVNDCKMHWQNRGDYLCVKVDRFNKSKKSTYTNFELFFLREKNVPIEVLEIKQSIIAFAWEPHGTRFAIIHSSETNPKEFPDVSFYGLEGTQLKHLKTLEKRPASHLFWSPRGDFIVLAGLRPASYKGMLEFYHVKDMETLATGDHSSATELEWDPTGRFVTTCASAWRHQLENGYCIWSFSGKLLSKILKDKLYQFTWRPRPPSLLTEDQIKEIQKNFKNYSKKYSLEESKRKTEAKKERQVKREKLRQDFLDYIQTKKKEFEEDEEKRKKLKIPILGEEESDYTLQNYEEILESYVEVDEP